MKKLHLLPLIGALALPTLLALHPPGDSLVFAPEDGSEVGMEFTNSLEFFLDDFAAEAMGQDIGAMMGDVEANVNVEIEVAFTDTYGSTADGKPLSFTRAFGDAGITGEATGSGGGESDSQSFELEGALSGTNVNFAWDEDESEYIATYPEDESGDEDLLGGLEARVDLAFLLPDGEVSKDDEWEIDPVELAKLLVPGGDLGYDTEEGDRESMADTEDEMNDDAIEALRSLMEGEVTATYKGLNDDGMAEVSIKLEIAGDRDFSDLIAQAIQAAADASGEDVPADQIPNIDSFDVSLALDGEGTLLWDPKTGHVNSFSMSAETELSLDVAMSMTQQDMEIPITGSIVLGGSAEIGLEASY
jgi:hypothetical protein